MRERLERAGRRFARLTTNVVVANPRLWRLFRGPIRAQFDRLAPTWDARRSTDWHEPLAQALRRLEASPRRILDLGTGTGIGARLLGGVYPDAEIVGVDLAPAMIEEARRLTPPQARITFQVADAARLPFRDAEFDLVLLANMIPFFDELARVAAREALLVFVFSMGTETPIFVPTGTLRERLAPHGFDRLEELEIGEATAVLARRSDPG